MKRITVTGAGGMTGRHMVSFLEEKCIPCQALTRKEWDIRQWRTFSELDSLLGMSEAVFHFAAQLPNETSTTEEIFDANVRSCLNLAEWAAERSIPLVFLSGATVYKDPHKENIMESDEKVINGFGGFYGYTKRLAENVIDHYRSEGLQCVVLRPSSIYGYGLSEDKLIPKYLSMASADNTISLSQPDNRINLIHAYDVARAAFSAFETESWGVFNVGSDCHSIVDIANAAVNAMGKGNVSTTQRDKGYKPFTRFDLNSSLAASAFGFNPRVNLEEGIRLMSLKQVRPC